MKIRTDRRPFLTGDRVTIANHPEYTGTVEAYRQISRINRVLIRWDNLSPNKHNPAWFQNRYGLLRRLEEDVIVMSKKLKDAG